MCGRYFFSEKTKNDLWDDFGIPGDTVPGESIGEITPGMSPVVLTESRSRISAGNMTWGYEGSGKLIINARAETVTEKPLFSYDVRHHRCILPASHFYEWDRDRTKTGFFRKDDSSIYLAGFYSPSEKRFIVITRPANDSVISCHDRMPLMMEKNEVLPWLFDDGQLGKLLAKDLPMLRSDREYEQLRLF